MPGYRRPFLIRFTAQNFHQIKSICQFMASVAASLVFGWMCAAPLLHLGGSADPGPVAGAAMSHHSSPYPDQHEYQQNAPGPRIVASGAGLGAVGEEL